MGRWGPWRTTFSVCAVPRVTVQAGGSMHCHPDCSMGFTLLEELLTNFGTLYSISKEHLE